MTLDERLVEMARAEIADVHRCEDAAGSGDDLWLAAILNVARRAAQEAREEERERAARISGAYMEGREELAAIRFVAVEIAAAIRGGGA